MSAGGLHFFPAPVVLHSAVGMSGYCCSMTLAPPSISSSTLHIHCTSHASRTQTNTALLSLISRLGLVSQASFGAKIPIHQSSLTISRFRSTTILTQGGCHDISRIIVCVVLSSGRLFSPPTVAFGSSDDGGRWHCSMTRLFVVVTIVAMDTDAR